MDWDAGRYAADIALTNDNDSHVLMIKLVGGGKRVLDVGCWTGQVGSVLAQYNRRVIGIELDPDAAEQAAKVLDDVVVADVSDFDFLATFGSDAFDAIVFGDVLEHVTEPAVVLRAATEVLTAGGIVVISLPNVAHGSVRLRLLSGTFDYTETGLLDRTHLRFFTRTSMEELLASAGLAPVEVRRTTIDPLLAPDAPMSEDVAPADLLAQLRDDPEALTYQFVVKAVRDDASHAVWRLAREADELRRNRRGSRPDDDDRLRLYVSLILDRRDDRTALATRLLERELTARMSLPVSVETVTADAPFGPSGWRPHLVLDARDTPAQATGPVRALAVAGDALHAVGPDVDCVTALGASAARVGSLADWRRAIDLWRATDRWPAGDRVLTVVVRDERDEELERLAVTLSLSDVPFEGVLVLAEQPSSMAVARFEALWPGRTSTAPLDLELDDLVAAFAGSAAVVTASAFDRLVAVAVGTPTAAATAGDGVLQELERSRSLRRAQADVAVAVDRALDAVLDGVREPASLPVDAEVRRLRDVVEHLQQRIVSERGHVLTHLTRLERSLEIAEDRAREAEIVERRRAALAEALAEQRSAIVELQEAFVRTARAVAPPPVSASRRLGRRVKRVLRAH